MLEGLLDLATVSPWAYAAILAITAIDAVFPVVPSEATVISAGVLAGAGELSIGLVIAAGAAGALLGDSGAYSIGRTIGPRVEPRLTRSRKAAERRDWAQEKLTTRGPTLLLVARFVPGGRTATTFTAGALGMRWTRFLVPSAAAGLIWASFAALLGFGGGKKFEEQPELALAVAFGIAGILVVVLEIGRRLRNRRSNLGDPTDSTARGRS